jgi:hypothetical protein
MRIRRNKKGEKGKSAMNQRWEKLTPVERFIKNEEYKIKKCLEGVQLLRQSGNTIASLLLELKIEELEKFLYELKSGKYDKWLNQEENGLSGSNNPEKLVAMT